MDAPPATPPDDSRALTLAAAALVCAVVLVRAWPLALFGTDAGCYARIAADLAARPLSTWADLRWDDGPFHEHPPLAFWLEALWFRLWGASAAAGVWLARLYALGTCALAWLAARRLAGPRAAALTLVGFATLASFVADSQNPMLEAPLTLAMVAALEACTRLPASRAAAAQFALAATAALWVKGAPALALLVAPAWAWWAGAPKGRVAAALLSAVGLSALTLAGYEALRASLGLEPFLSTHLNAQVVQSFAEGRHNPQPNPLFYLGTLASWHTPVLVAIPVAAWRWKHLDAGTRKLAVLGGAWVLAIAGGFSLAANKNHWYANPLVPGAAWLVGVGLFALLALAPLKLTRWLPRVLFAAAAGWCAVFLVLGTRLDTPRQHAIRAMAQTPAQLQGVPVADCSPLGEWVSRHLMAFHWNGERTGCHVAAPWRFDGTSLVEQK